MDGDSLGRDDGDTPVTEGALETETEKEADTEPLEERLADSRGVPVMPSAVAERPNERDARGDREDVEDLEVVVEGLGSGPEGDTSGVVVMATDPVTHTESERICDLEGCDDCDGDCDALEDLLDEALRVSVGEPELERDGTLDWDSDHVSDVLLAPERDTPLERDTAGERDTEGELLTLALGVGDAEIV